jgi:hypothetical protein
MESRRKLRIEKVRGESRPVVWVWRDDLNRFREIVRKHNLKSEERSPSRYQVCFRFDQNEDEVFQAIEEFNIHHDLEKTKGEPRI